MNQEQGGRFFRDAWIAGVKRYYEGTPKEGSIAPWEAMSSWEQESAQTVYEQVQQFVVPTNEQMKALSRGQKGRFVCLCWIGQILKHFSEPKESYIAEWERLPHWQQETDSDIFEAIERKAIAER